MPPDNTLPRGFWLLFFAALLAFGSILAASVVILPDRPLEETRKTL